MSESWPPGDWDRDRLIREIAARMQAIQTERDPAVLAEIGQLVDRLGAWDHERSEPDEC